MSEGVKLLAMTPQPPASADAPLPSEATEAAPKKWNWLTWVGIILAIGCVFWLTQPHPRYRKKADQTEAVNNARQIGLALSKFETEYGCFPDEGTISKVKAKNSTDFHLATKTSNEFFRQLIAAKIAPTEQMFYAKVGSTRKPDGIITVAESLKKSECGFTYLSGLSTTGSLSRPLVVTPLIPGTDRFDPKPFQGKAVILRIDNSVTSLPIRKDGHVWIDGMNFLDPSHPIWEGKPPVIAWPE